MKTKSTLVFYSYYVPKGNKILKNRVEKAKDLLKENTLVNNWKLAEVVAAIDNFISNYTDKGSSVSRMQGFKPRQDLPAL